MPFQETKEGQTNFCPHTADNSICDKYLGKSKIQQYQEEVLKKYHKAHKYTFLLGGCLTRNGNDCEKEICKFIASALQGQLKVAENILEEKKKENLNCIIGEKTRRIIEEENQIISNIQSLLQNK